MTHKVVILGGGIAGLSAAHELLERGFQVEVYESLGIPGGKARSMALPGTGTQGRRDLPGEHGFRFFPRFYRHVVDTMRRIPYRGGTVADNLVDTSRCQLARYGQYPIDVTARFPRTMPDVRVVLDDFSKFLGGSVGLSQEELAFFATKVWQIVTSCSERRATEYEKLNWWEFIGADSQSAAYQKLLGHGITRSLVAAKARLASTKTIGNIFVQLLFDIVQPGPSTDRVLNGPTNDVWIDPWVEYLKAKGMKYHYRSKVKGVTFEGGRIRAAQFVHDGAVREVSGDIFLLSVPVEDVIDLITPAMVEADPALGALFTLDDITEWMNGIQFYLNEDVKVTHGHVIYVDSPWALTSISQAQFWRGVDLSKYGDGTVRGIISVDISEWNEPGICGKAARDCTNEEIKNEIWEQLKRSLNAATTVLRDEQLVAWSLDPSIQWSKNGTIANEEPLLVNLVDTWKLRPEAVTRIPNLFLAADYVRTFTDLATMEAANEAARRAVNGILEATGSTAPACGVWDLHEPEIFAPWRELDRIRFVRGLPWDDTLVKLGLSAQQVLSTVMTHLEAGSEQPTGPTAFLQSQLMGAMEQVTCSESSLSLRGDVMACIERLSQLLALRFAEAEARSAGTTTSAVGRGARGGLQIVPT